MRKSLILLGILVLVGGAWAADNATKVARIKVATPGLLLNLKGRPSKVIGKFEDVPVTAARELTARPGSYETNSILLSVQDARKEIWTLTCAKNFGKLKTIEVAAGETATIEAGPPLTVKVSISRLVDVEPKAAIPPGAAAPAPPAAGPKDLLIHIDYIGKAGEYYSPRALKGKSVGPKPRVRICNEEGYLLAEGEYRFAYTSGVG